MKLTYLRWSSVVAWLLHRPYLVCLFAFCFHLFVLASGLLINKICGSGNFDEINEPSNMSDYSKKTVCFLMFIDEITEKYLKESGRLGSSKKIGLWRIIVTRNIPYTDARRTGKVSKFGWHCYGFEIEIGINIFPYIRCWSY